MRGPDALEWVDRLDAEHDNLRAALAWSLEQDGDAGLRLSGALGWFWWSRSNHTEGRRWLARALNATSERTRARAKALHGAGWLAHHQRDLREARSLFDESLSIARELGRSLDNCVGAAWARSRRVFRERSRWYAHPGSRESARRGGDR